VAGLGTQAFAALQPGLTNVAPLGLETSPPRASCTPLELGQAGSIGRYGQMADVGKGVPPLQGGNRLGAYGTQGCASTLHPGLTSGAPLGLGASPPHGSCTHTKAGWVGRNGP
jgi:hypothetical protein